MKSLRWVFYGIYVITSLYIGRFIFEIRKKRMTQEEKDAYVQRYVAKWAKNITEATGTKVRVTGAENLPEENCLFVSNHQDYFDILVMLGFVSKPTAFIAKKELEKFPGVSYWMREMHCVFIDREDTRESIKSVLEGIDNLKKGYTMQVCPEGTRSNGPALGEFKKGSLKLAFKSEVPVVPVTINNTYKITGGKGIKDIKAVDVDIIISRPISVKGMSREEQNNLSERIKGIIQENLNANNGKVQNM